MKILKYLLFLILLIIIGTAIYFGTKDGTYTIEDSIVIPAPAEVVFDKVNDLKSWESWGPWKKEGNITFTYAEKTSGEGASYSWQGEKNGSMTTTKVIPNNEIQQDLSMETPRGEKQSKVLWGFEKIEGGTKVNWTINGTHSMMDKAYYSISGFNFASEIHQMKKEALVGISHEVTEEMKKYSINVDGVTSYGGGYYMYTTSVAKQSELEEKTKPMMHLVMDFVTNNNLNRGGNPFSIYNEIDDINGTVIFSTAVPVKERVITPEGSPVVCGFMDAVSAVKITLKGSYEHLPEAYVKGREYLRLEGLQVDPNAKLFEVYLTDPEEVVNPANWLTEVYIPIISVPELNLEGIQ